MGWSKKLWIIACSILTMASGYAADELMTFDNETLRERYSELVFQLRCPKCENQNVADSNAPISEDIRQKTYEMLHQGYTDQEIMDFMIARYSEFVTYKPQLSIVTVWLWIVPFLLLAFGLAILWHLTHKRDSQSSMALTEEETQRLNSLLGDKTE